MYSRLKCVLFSLLLVLIFQTGLYAAVRLSVDKPTATLEDQIILTISVDEKGDEPQIMGLDDFEVNAGGRSSRVEIINGHMSSSTSYTYYLYPRKNGSFIVGPAVITVDGKKVKSNRLKIVITKSSGKPADRKIFATASISKNEPYLYEPVIYILKLFRRVDLADISIIKPSFNGFSIVEQEKEKTYRENVGRVPYNVSELRFHLVPRTAGKVGIEPTRLSIDIIEQVRQQNPFNNFGNFGNFGNLGSFGNFGGRVKTRRISTNDLSLNVKPLPQQGKDRLFTNLVGEFGIQGSISAETALLGDSINLKITISGVGNIADFVDPEVEDNGLFKLYSDKPVIKQNTGINGLFGEILLSKAIVPTRSGSVEVPPFRFKYFSTKEGQYKVISTPVFKIMVSPSKENRPVPPITVASAESPKKTVNKEVIKPVGKDIFPVHPGLPEASGEFVLVTPLHMAAVAAGPLLFIFAWLAGKRKEMLESGSGLKMKRKTARKLAIKKLAELKKTAPDAGFKAIERTVREYLGHRFGFNGTVMTNSEIVASLKERNIATVRVEELFATLEGLSFAGRDAQQNGGGLLERAKSIIDEMEKVKK